jgi:hypothetical protein
VAIFRTRFDRSTWAFGEVDNAFGSDPKDPGFESPKARLCCETSVVAFVIGSYVVLCWHTFGLTDWAFALDAGGNKNKESPRFVISRAFLLVMVASLPGKDFFDVSPLTGFV